MRFPTCLAALALGLASTPCASADPGIAPTTSRLGTKVDWVLDRTQAYARARRTGRLVLELHLSGDFTDPGRT